MGFSISMRIILAQRIRRVSARQAWIFFPQCPISFANNDDSQVQWKPFPDIIHVAPSAGWKALKLLCLKKLPDTDLPPPRT